MTFAYTFQALDGTPDRTCTGCGGTFPETAEFFYQTRSTGYFWRCHPCARAYFRAKAQARYERRFGIEIEYAGTTDDAVRAVGSSGFDCAVEGYNHNTVTYWKVVSDSSVNGGYELVSPPLRGPAGRSAVTAVCDAMREEGCSLNSSCGLHVHHDMRGVTLSEFKKLFTLVYMVQRALDCFVAPSRRNGEWAMHITDREVDRVNGIRSMTRRGVSAAAINRFKVLNIDAYTRHGTVEFRSHQGTLSGRKIVAWVEVGQALIKWAKSDHAAPVESVTDGNALLSMLTQYGALPSDQADYLTERIGTLGRVGYQEENAEPERDYDDAEECGQPDYCNCEECEEVRDSRHGSIDTLSTSEAYEHVRAVWNDTNSVQRNAAQRAYNRIGAEVRADCYVALQQLTQGERLRLERASGYSDAAALSLTLQAIAVRGIITDDAFRALIAPSQVLDTHRHNRCACSHRWACGCQDYERSCGCASCVICSRDAAVIEHSASVNRQRMVSA